MEITIFAWIFVFIFFLIYTAVQTQRCCKFLQKSIASRRTNNTETTTVSQIYTVESNSRQPTASSNCRVNFSVQEVDGSLHWNRGDHLVRLSRSLSIQSDNSKHDDGLPSYEEAIAVFGSHNVTNNPMNFTPLSTAQLSSLQPVAGQPPSVVINIQAQVSPT